MPYLVRVIGMEKFGVVSLIQALQYYFIILVDYGFSITSIKDISVAQTDRKRLSVIFCKTLSTKFLLVVISFALVIALVFMVPKFREDSEAYLLGFSLVIGQMLFPIWFFQGIEQMKFITYLNLFSKIIFAGCLFIFVHKESDYIWVLPIQGLGVILASVVGIFVIISRFKIDIIFPGRKVILSELRTGFPVFMSNFSVTAYNSSNYLILGFFGGDIVLGMFSIAEKVTSLLRQILSMLSQAIFPQVCQLAERSHIELRKFWKKLIMPFAIALFLMCLLVAYHSTLIVSIISGEDLTEAANLLSLIIWVPVIVLFNIPFFLTLLAYDKKKEVMKVLLVSSIFSIIISFYLTYQFHALGTVSSLLITEFVITLGLLFALERDKKISILT